MRQSTTQARHVSGHQQQTVLPQSITVLVPMIGSSNASFGTSLGMAGGIIKEVNTEAVHHSLSMSCAIQHPCHEGSTQACANPAVPFRAAPRQHWSQGFQNQQRQHPQGPGQYHLHTWHGGRSNVLRHTPPDLQEAAPDLAQGSRTWHHNTLTGTHRMPRNPKLHGMLSPMLLTAAGLRSG
mmetsp:Transcript_128383/g.256431  ORF Transcript_128383/g.256431 Transcript_128383/m.256431 type:complete len:181 (-) Transcript_128383:207-749(-)